MDLILVRSDVGRGGKIGQLVEKLRAAFSG